MLLSFQGADSSPTRSLSPLSILHTALEGRVKQMLAITNCTDVGNTSDKMSLASMPSSAVTIKGHKPVLACQPEGTIPGGWSHCVPGLQGNLEVTVSGPMMHDPLWIALVVTGSCSCRRLALLQTPLRRLLWLELNPVCLPGTRSHGLQPALWAALPHDRLLNPCRQFSCPLQVFSRQSRPGSSIPSSDDMHGFKSPYCQHINI